MSMSNAAELALLALILTNANWANLGDATGVRGSTAAGNIELAFHTADPGEAGDQTTSEATYGGYSRTALGRTSTVWDVTTNPSTNKGVITVPTWTSGSTNTLTFFSLGVSHTGASQIVVSGALTNSVVMSAGNPTASIAIGALTVTAD